MSTRASTTGSALGLAGLLGFAAAGHFTRPQFFDPTIPAALPGRPRDWVIGSGVAEAAVAMLVAVPRTRRLGGLAAVALFVGVYPANVQMAVDAWRKRGQEPGRLTVMLVRLPLQIPLVLWARRVHAGGR